MLDDSVYCLALNKPFFYHWIIKFKLHWKELFVKFKKGFLNEQLYLSFSVYTIRKILLIFSTLKGINSVNFFSYFYYRNPHDYKNAAIKILYFQMENINTQIYFTLQKVYRVQFLLYVVHLKFNINVVYLKSTKCCVLEIH